MVNHQMLSAMKTSSPWCLALTQFFSFLFKIVTFNNKSNDVSLRVSAIDYLGVVAAHLRKDAVNSQQDTESITEILVEVTKKVEGLASFYVMQSNQLGGKLSVVKRNLTELQ